MGGEKKMGRWAWRRPTVVRGFWGEPHPLNDQSESGLQPRGGTGAYLSRDWIVAGRREGAASLRGLPLGNSALYIAVAAVVEAGWTAAHVPGYDALRLAA